MIFIDNQENRSGITDLLDGMGVEYEMCQLKLCDYHVTGENGLVVIEHKNPEDYVGSLISGHLSDQLTRMSQEFDLSFLLVDGSISGAVTKGNITRKTYFSSLAGTYIKRALGGKQGAVCIIQTDNDWDTALLLERIQHRMNDPDGLVRTPYIGAPQVAGGNNQVRCLCAIPGVGETIARGLLRFYGTVGRIAKADKNELMDVPKVGEKIATAIVDHFRQIYEET